MKSIKRITSFTLVFVMVITLLTVCPLPTVYAMTENNAVEWARSQVGEMIGDGQCTRLSEAYAWQFFGFMLGRSPKDYPSIEIPNDWQLIKYSPGFIPSAGDIAIWEPGSGSWGWIANTGHTAIIISATKSEIVSVDQNWNAGGSGSTAKIVTHSYNSFWGVLRPFFNGKEGHQIPIPNADITGDTVIKKGDSAELTINFSGIGPWKLVYMENNVELKKTFYDQANVLNVYPSTTTTYSLKSVTDSSYNEFIEFLSGEVTIKVLQLDSANFWARDGIAAAIAKGFVADDLQDNYSDIITRAEFCRMAINWMESATGKNIDAVLAKKGLSRNPIAFADSSDPDILAAFALGVTNGVGNNLFDPNGQFSREQAATMIMNTCKAIGSNVDNPPASSFADIGSASSWAVNGINFVSANGIMQGTGDNNFSPSAPYTREQSIITFNNINQSTLPVR